MDYGKLTPDEAEAEIARVGALLAASPTTIHDTFGGSAGRDLAERASEMLGTSHEGSGSPMGDMAEALRQLHRWRSGQSGADLLAKDRQIAALTAERDDLRASVDEMAAKVNSLWGRAEGTVKVTQ